jgi:hypothetical protein
MNEPGAEKPVERLFPLVLRFRKLIIGRDNLARSKSRLHFVLITTDISEASRAYILADFAHYPVVQRYTGADLDRFFGIKGAKTVGFEKSELAKTIFVELKQYRINLPLHPSKGEKEQG